MPGWRTPPHRCRPVAFADWCHDWRLFGAVRHLLALLLRRMWTLGLVRTGCGEGECGGSRLVGSEKSPIVTLSAVRGAGRADRERTDEDCVHRTRGWDLSRLQESAVLAGYRSPRHTAGVRCSDVAGIVRHPAVSGCFTWAAARAAASCRRSLSTPGMDRSPPRLSQSDSRLHAVKLTEPDSITILSAYDST